MPFSLDLERSLRSRSFAGGLASGVAVALYAVGLLVPIRPGQHGVHVLGPIALARSEGFPYVWMGWIFLVFSVLLLGMSAFVSWRLWAIAVVFVAILWTVFSWGVFRAIYS